VSVVEQFSKRLVGHSPAVRAVAIAGVILNLALVVTMSAAWATLYQAPTSNKLPEDNSATQRKRLAKGESSQRPSASPKTEISSVRQDEKPLTPINSSAGKPAEDAELQRKLVRFTFWLVIVGGLQVLALIVQAFVFWRTLRAINGQLELMRSAGQDTHDLAQQAVRQTDLTESQLELTHRPWVSVEVAVVSNLIFDERGAVLMLNATMRNLGSSVAKHVSLWTQFVVGGVHDLNQAHESLCNIMKQPVNEKSDYGSLVFPGQVVTEPRPIIASQEDIGQALKNGPFKEVNAIGLHLIGCVDYQSSFDPKKHHQTRFVYLVGRIDEQRNVVMGTFHPLNKSYQRIVLTPTMHGASAD